MTYKYFTNKSWSEVQSELPEGAIIAMKCNAQGYYKIIRYPEACKFPKDRESVELNIIKQ